MISMNNILFKPSPCINYKFVSIVYAAFSILGCLLYILETFVLPTSTTTKATISTTISSTTMKNQQQNQQPPSNNHNVMMIQKELAESIQGLYLIFLPFVPCFLWSLGVLRAALVMQKRQSTGDNTNTTATTNDKDKQH
jgi:hypothetical protein